MRRIIAGSAAFFVLTGTFLVLPVYAAPTPEAEAVAPSIAQVDLGSVDEPAADAVVTTDGVVVAAGAEAAVEPGDTVGVSPEASPDPEPTDPSDIALTGAELPGVPALSVSRPDSAGFSAVGVTWAYDPDISSVEVTLRVQDEDGTWGEWTTLEQDDAEQTPSATADGEVRDGTAPYFTGPAMGVEVVVQTPAGSAPADVRTQLIDPGTSAADSTTDATGPQDQAHAASTMPAVYTRAQWGADESIRTWDPEYAPTIRAATIHHTADSNNYTADQVPAMMRSIYAFHTISRGWGDIGYNVIVDKFGRIWEGRYGGLARPVVGAHAGGFNYGTFGVSMLGDYDTAPTTPALIESVAAIVAWKFSLHGVNPNGTTQLTSAGGGTARYAAGTVVTLPTIFGHRDVGSTTCPGQYGYAQLPTIRSIVAIKVAAQSVPSGALDSVTPGELGVTVSGWAYDSDVPSGQVPLHVYVDGAFAGQVIAGTPRGDIAAAFPGAGELHGYHASIAVPAGQRQVCVYAINLGAGSSNPQLGCRTVTVTGPTADPRGALRVVNAVGNRLLMSGFAFDDDHPSIPVDVHIYLDGALATAVNASAQDASVERDYPGKGSQHGFVTDVRASAGVHRVCAYAINLGPGGNSALGCQTVTASGQANAPLGSLDGMAVDGVTATINGWTIDPDVLTGAVPVHVYLDGALASAVLADAARSDLAAAFPGTGGSHAYSASLRLPAGNHQVCAYAINLGSGSANTPLGCRTTTIAGSAWEPTGSLDGASVSGRTVRVGGWAVDEDAIGDPVAVHAYVDGQFAGAVMASGSRPDLAAALPRAGAAHGYSLAFSVRSGVHQVCVYAINVGSGAVNPQLGCRSVTVAATSWDPYGSLDSATRSAGQVTASGWATDPDTGTGPVVVHLYVDGAAVLGVSTGLSRPDVAAVFPALGSTTGFSGTFAVPAGQHTICAYAINAGDGATNTQLGCRLVSA